MKKTVFSFLLILAFMAVKAQDVPQSKPVVKSVIYVPQALPPSSPTIGEKYLSTNGNYYRWDGSAWVLDVQSAPADGSETKVTGGSNVTITGTGTDIDPYIVNSSGGATADGLGNARNVGALTILDQDNATLNAGINANKIGDGSVSNTAFQYIANLANNAQQQIDSKFNNTGGLIAGNISFGNSFRAVNLLDPVNPQDAVTLNHLNSTVGANNLKSEPTGRTNEENYSNVIGQRWADSDSDGLAPPGTLVLEFEVPPAFISTGTTLNMDDYRGYNTGVSAATSYILDVPEVGGFAYSFVNAATEPTFDGSGVGVTVVNPVGSLDFIPNDNMLGIVWMLTSTTALQWWIDIP